MKFNDILNKYINLIECSSKDIATYSDLSESIISRYRSGNRIPNNENLKNKIGQNIEVLIEDISFDGKFLIGRTSQDVPEEDGIIYIENTTFENKVNTFVNVKITKVKEYDLIGKIAN